MSDIVIIPAPRPKFDLTPEQIFLINDMIKAWLPEDQVAEFRQAFRNDCKRLLASALVPHDREAT